MNSEIQQRPEAQDFNEMSRENRKKIYDVLDDLENIRRYYERNPDEPLAKEKIQFVERQMQRVDDFIAGNLTIRLAELDKYVQKWDERAEVIQSNDPAVKAFKKVLIEQPYIPRLAKTEKGNTTYVRWGAKRAQSSSLEGTLITAGMGPCCSLAIVDTFNNKQTLAHVYPHDPGTKGDKTPNRHASDMHTVITEMLPQSTEHKKQAMYYVIEGNSQNRNNAFRIFASLYEAGVSPDRVKFVPRRENIWADRPSGSILTNENIMIQRGNVVRAPYVLEIKAVAANNWQVVEETISVEQRRILSQELRTIWNNIWPEYAKKYQIVKQQQRTPEKQQDEISLLVMHMSRDLHEHMLKNATLKKTFSSSENARIAIWRYMDAVSSSMELEPEKYLEHR